MNVNAAPATTESGVSTRLTLASDSRARMKACASLLKMINTNVSVSPDGKVKLNHVLKRDN